MSVSVSKLKERVFPPFRADETAARLAGTSDYPNMTPQQVKASWRQSSMDGTSFHAYVARSLHAPVVRAVDKPEYKQFAAFKEEVLSKHVNCEWFSETRIDAGTFHGTPDLWVAGDGRVTVYDWKRIRDLCDKPYCDSAGVQQFGFGAAEGVPHCNFSHYSLQLWLYALLIETRGYEIDKLFIVVFHPNREQYHMREAAPLRHVAEALVQSLGSPGKPG